MSNVVNLFGEKKRESVSDLKKRLYLILEREIVKLEDEQDHKDFLCALACLTADECVNMAYATSVAPNSSVYAKGLKKMIDSRYRDEGFEKVVED
jgi:hypothetical protein